MSHEGSLVWIWCRSDGLKYNLFIFCYFQWLIHCDDAILTIMYFKFETPVNYFTSSIYHTRKSIWNKICNKMVLRNHIPKILQLSGEIVMQRNLFYRMLQCQCQLTAWSSWHRNCLLRGKQRLLSTIIYTIIICRHWQVNYLYLRKGDYGWNKTSSCFKIGVVERLLILNIIRVYA